MAGGGVKKNFITVKGGADGITYIPNINGGMLSWSTQPSGMPVPSPVQIIPIKGVDYFTEHEKNEIIEEVINAIRGMTL